MLRLTALSIVLGLVAACGDAHLGEGYGKRTKSALDVQAQDRESAGPAPLDAQDAKVVLARHRGKPVGGATDTSGATAVTGGYGIPVVNGGAPIMTVGGAEGAGGATANPGPIRLEAK